MGGAELVHPGNDYASFQKLFHPSFLEDDPNKVFFDSKAPGLVISRRYGRVKPAKNHGGLASPLRCSRSSSRAYNLLGAKQLLVLIENGLVLPLVRTGPGGPPFRNALK
jgi:hypothetical protein